MYNKYTFCLTFSFNKVTFSKTYARKQKLVFFLNSDTVYTPNGHQGIISNEIPIMYSVFQQAR